MPAHSVRFVPLGSFKKTILSEVVSNTEVISRDPPVATNLSVTVETYSRDYQITVKLRIENTSEAAIDANEYIQAIHVWTSTAYPPA